MNINLESSLKKLLFVTNIGENDISGGFSAMNSAMYSVIDSAYSATYCGPINPKPRLFENLLSKTQRMLGGRGDFFFFSERRLSLIAGIIKNKTRDNIYDAAVFHGFTPWVLYNPSIPYAAWNDCTFKQYIDIYHDRALYKDKDIMRIVEHERNWLNAADRVFFRSRWAVEAAIRDYSLSSDKVGFVGNYGFIEIPDGDRYEDRKDFLIVTTSFHKKGGNEVFRAFARVYETNCDVRLIIVGDRPNSHVLAHSGVVYLGWLDKSIPDHREQLSKVYESAICLVHPTRADTNPMVVIEAGYHGCPVISTKSFALQELVLNEISGILLDDVTDVNSLERAMRDVLRLDSAYFDMRRRAREHTLSHYTKAAFSSRVKMEIDRFIAGLI